MVSDLIAEQLRQLPARPGVYLMRNAAGKIIYVGKAAELCNRVRSYFQSGSKDIPKVQQMVPEIHSIDFFVTGSEQEALILEGNFIKRYRPRYNIRLMDDKSFPYIKINMKEDWPVVSFTRRLLNDGANYFGPFASPKSVRGTLKALEIMFPFRSCNKPVTGREKRPCLKYHIGHCLAPCIGAVGKGEYHRAMRQIILFLQGRQKAVVKEIQREMKRASDDMDYEKAARLRDRLQSIKSVIEGQRIATTVKGEQDVVAFAAENDRACVQVFFIRNGEITGRESFHMVGTSTETPEQIMTSFVKQFYGSANYVPPLLLLQYPIDDRANIEAWLEEKRGSRVIIIVPQKGNRKQLVEIVARNASHGLELERIRHFNAPNLLNNALEELKKELGLPDLPSRIEGYDISNIQGREAVGSMVVFEEGKPAPSRYRRFRIKTVSGANDYAMLQEVLQRRFRRVSSGDEAGADTWRTLPDLVLIDGGKGQLNAAREAMVDVKAADIPVASLAKENEEIFIPDKKTSIVLPRNSPGLQILQRVRDEAHRFAITYHTGVRRKQSFLSSLDGIDGIGPKRKRALLAKFGTVKGIREASAEDLGTVKGMTPALIQKLKGLLG